MQLITQTRRVGTWVLAIAVLCGMCLVSARQIARTDGTAMTSGGTPTITACGTTPSGSVVGTDTAGTISVGGGVVTACTLSFSSTLTSAPACVMTPSSSGVAIGLATTTAAAAISLSVTLGGGKIFYHCL